MFSLCAEPPQLEENDLYHLCPSLNAPVVNVDVLPVGPVRAAIVLHATQTGDGSRVPQLTVGLRSLETGNVAVYQYSGEVRKLQSASQALDVALSFAEAMGFLFDDDLVGGAGGPGRSRALSLWQKLVGQQAAGWDSKSGFAGVVDAGDLDPQQAELLLADPADPEPAPEPRNLLERPADEQAATVSDAPQSPALAAKGADVLGSHAAGGAAAADPERDPTVRTRSTDDDRGTSRSGSSMLGRVPLVRMRVKPKGGNAGDSEEDERRRLQLLASF